MRKVIAPLLLSFPVLLFLVFLGCSKSEHGIAHNQTTFADSALEFIRGHVDQSQVNQYDLSSFNVLKVDGVDRIIVVKSRDANSSLMAEKTDGKFSGYYVNYQSDKSNNGRISTAEFGLVHSSEVYFHEGIPTKKIEKRNGVVSVKDFTKKHDGLLDGTHIDNSEIVAVTESEGPPQGGTELPPVYVVSSGQSQTTIYSIYWQLAQNATYYNYYSSTNTYASGGGSSVGLPSKQSNSTPLASINDEIKCFTQKTNATYKVKITVNQPNPSKPASPDNVVNLSQDHNVGHCYLSFEEDDADGTVIVRNVGWYPQNGANPAHPIAPGVWVNDTGTPGSASLEATVNYASFNAARNYVSTKSGNYNLSTSNCTDIAIAGFAQTGIQLPHNTDNVTFLFVSWYNGTNPQRLGDDIKNLNTATLAPGTPIEVKKASSNTLYAKTRQGGCN